MHSPTASSQIRLFLLGSLEVRVGNGEPLNDFVKQPKRAAFITYLALAPRGWARRRDDLLAMFFPDSSEGPARNALNQMLYRVRSALGESALRSTDQEIGLNGDSVWCDAVELREAAAAGDDRRVLALYRGPLLDGFQARGVSPEYDLWLARERAELRDLAVTSAWRLSDAELAAGNPAGAEECAHAAVRIAPDREDDVARLAMLSAAVKTQARPNAPEGKRNRRRVVALAGVAFLGIALAGALLLGKNDDPEPVLAVGDIRMESPADSQLPVALLLSTNIARVAGLDVITDDRVRELTESAGNRRRAALQAGATEVVEGVLSRRGPTYRLDFRRVDAQSRASGGHIVEANDLFELIDLATEHIAKDFDSHATAIREKGGTRSVIAYRLYERGLDAMGAGDYAGALKLFRGALEEDSSFAMAAYYEAATSGHDHERLYRRARKLAEASPPRERLFITAQSKIAFLERGAVEVAESLAAYAPRDPDALMVYGRALSLDGRYAESGRQFLRVADLDTVGLYDEDVRCRSCEAHYELRIAYMSTDSLRALERTARQWARHHPKSKRVQNNLIWALESLELFDEAEAAARSAFGPQYRVPTDLTGVWIRKLRFDDVDAHWQNELRTKNDDSRSGAFWGQFISMRTQGRLNEALIAARGYRDLHPDREALLEGIALHEMGRFREAARIHEAHARKSAGERSQPRAMWYAWDLAHAAASYAALGDTARLRSIEDTIRVYGALSASSRHQRLHHYVRGLRLRVLGREREALEAFEAAMVTASYGYNRMALELGRASLANGKPQRAIEVLRSSLRGPISANGLYASRTDLMEILGDAYVMNQQPDSAAAVYGRVLESWKKADPSMRPRIASVRARLEGLRMDRPRS